MTDETAPSVLEVELSKKIAEHEARVELLTKAEMVLEQDFKQKRKDYEAAREAAESVKYQLHTLVLALQTLRECNAEAQP